MGGALTRRAKHGGVAIASFTKGEQMSELELAREVLHASRRLVVLTGAGISAASGVPIGRVNHDATSFLTTVTTRQFEEDPERVWKLHYGLRSELERCRPNAAHQALADAARLSSHVLLTQNIDGLHEQSGHPKVFALHGTLWANRCTACGTTKPDRTRTFDGLPRSTCCDAPERPDIIWVKDRLNDAVLDYATMAVGLCDVFLVVGTSATVMPSGRFPERVARRDGFVIEVNPNPLGLVPADITLRERAEDILPVLFLRV